MKLGVLTALFGDQSLEKALDTIAEIGVEAVEFGTGNFVGNAHCNPNVLLESGSKLKEFEEGCNTLIVDKLKLYVNQLTEELKAKAQKMADETIAKDPDAYLPEQVKQLPYLNFQKLLATDPKIAERIPADLIKDHLYDTPVFENPFK